MGKVGHMVGWRQYGDMHTTLTPPPSLKPANKEVYLKHMAELLGKAGPYAKRSLTARKMHLLVVDDDHFTRQTVTLLLNDPRLIIHFAETAAEAVEKYTLLHPHMVFLDIELPDVSGLELLALVTKADRHAHAIMLTGSKVAEQVTFARDNGAKGYIVKPFNRQKLVECVQRFMGNPV